MRDPAKANESILSKIHHALTFKSPKGTGPLPLGHIAKATGMTELVAAEQLFANGLNRLLESGSVLRRNCAGNQEGSVDLIAANLVKLTGLPQWLVLTIVWWIFHHLDETATEKKDSSVGSASYNPNEWGLLPYSIKDNLPSDDQSAGV